MGFEIPEGLKEEIDSLSLEMHKKVAAFTQGRRFKSQMISDGDKHTLRITIMTQEEIDQEAIAFGYAPL